MPVLAAARARARATNMEPRRHVRTPNPRLRLPLLPVLATMMPSRDLPPLRPRLATTTTTPLPSVPRRHLWPRTCRAREISTVTSGKRRRKWRRKRKRKKKKTTTTRKSRSDQSTRLPSMPPTTRAAGVVRRMPSTTAPISPRRTAARRHLPGRRRTSPSPRHRHRPRRARRTNLPPLRPTTMTTTTEPWPARPLAAQRRRLGPATRTRRLRSRIWSWPSWSPLITESAASAGETLSFPSSACPRRVPPRAMPPRRPRRPTTPPTTRPARTWPSGRERM